MIISIFLLIFFLYLFLVDTFILIFPSITPFNNFIIEIKKKIINILSFYNLSQSPFCLIDGLFICLFTLYIQLVFVLFRFHYFSIWHQQFSSVCSHLIDSFYLIITEVSTHFIMMRARMLLITFVVIPLARAGCWQKIKKEYSLDKNVNNINERNTHIHTKNNLNTHTLTIITVAVMKYNINNNMKLLLM